jgi:quercetin 2,3-dioxygenase
MLTSTPLREDWMMAVMTPEESLSRGKLYLDDATENLTFDEFGWAFEDAWHGVGFILNALREQPLATLELGEKGSLPIAGSLDGLLARLVEAPKAARVVGRMEAMRKRMASSATVPSEEVTKLVFEAWELHDACGQRLQLVDDRLGDRLMLTDVSPGRVGSRVIERRTALKILAVGSMLPLQACKKVEMDNRPVAAAQPPAALRQEPTVAPATIKALSPMNGMHWQTRDPFLFLAYHQDDYPAGNESMGPAASLDGRHIGRDFEGRDNWRMYHGRTIPGFPRHPHRGFETVTVVRTGLLDHADSMGATARYGDGDVQWLTAGGGIQHAEMFPLVRSDAPNPTEFFQIWLNLPRKNKMVDPHFKMLWNEKIPRVVEQDEAGRLVELTIPAGAYKDSAPPSPPPNSWASQPGSDVAIWTLRMEAGAKFELPTVAQGTVRTLYVHRGAGVRIGDRSVSNMTRVEFEDHGPVVLEAGSAETEILMLQGRPIGEPVAQRGPFVMNTQDEIRQAYADYQRTSFGGWRWGQDGPVHARKKGRFAIHADGYEDEPV